MILVGPMQLHQPQPLDPMEPFFTGTQSDGGYWLDASRLSAHNHTGGLNGNAVTAVIPPGSITAGQLDPAVLAPYALTDGSKPFSGQVTMQADAIIRDALFFGPQGSAAAPDVTLTRTGAGALRLDGNLAVAAAGGLAPAALHRPEGLAYLTYLALTRAGVAKWHLGLNDTDGFALYRGDQAKIPVAVSTTGTTTLTPDAGQPAVSAGGAIIVNGSVYPPADNVGNVGLPSNRFNTLFAVTGTINTSSAEAKTDLTPLAPAAALAAVLATDPVQFRYTAPAPTAEQYELPDDPEQAEPVLHQRLVNAPLMEAARSQAGFVLHDETGGYQTDRLFETGFGQSNSANTAGVLLAAVHELARRLEVLEGA